VTYQHVFFLLLQNFKTEESFACKYRTFVSDFQSPPEEVSVAVDVALEVGYRHIDTAFLYQNEAAIGKTLKKWFDSGKLKREDVFFVTKVSSAEKCAFHHDFQNIVFYPIKSEKYTCSYVLKL
jgi:predicted aldo/keto reductase-like oxidoreductase